jgi:hypothetical protein
MEAQYRPHNKTKLIKITRNQTNTKIKEYV